MRDPRRLFTKMQRLSIWVEARGLCQKCGAGLGEDWEAHHVHQYALGGETEVWNGLALCAGCHRREHTAMAFRKDYSWQQACVTQMMKSRREFYADRKGDVRRAYTVSVTPSGGKSVFSMMAAREMIAANLVDKVVFVVPRESIKGGFSDDAKLVRMPPHARLAGEDSFRLYTNDIDTRYVGVLNNYHGIVVTYQSLPGRMPYFRDFLSDKRRLMFVLDEAHHSGENNEDEADATFSAWGAAVEKIASISNAVICMSGTPIRSDGRRLPLWRYEETPEGEFVSADFSFSYADAIDAGVARKLVIKPKDPVVRYAVSDGHGEEDLECLLSSVPDVDLGEARKPALASNGHTVEQMLIEAFEMSEHMRRKGDEDAAILVVVEPNAKGSDTNNLPVIKERIRSLFGEDALAVESRDGPDAAAAIQAFKNVKRDHRRWIVAKTMISEGTSIKRLRNIVILRQIRSRTLYHQLVHRATRNDSDEMLEDAYIWQFAFREMSEWGRQIEREWRDAIDRKPTKEIRCQACKAELEYLPRESRPCRECGYYPEGDGPGPEPERNVIGLEAIPPEEETTHIPEVGDIRHPTWLMAKQVHERQNAKRTSLAAVAEVLHILDGIDHPQEAPTNRSKDEKCKDLWETGNADLKSAAGMLLRRNGDMEYAEIIQRMLRECKKSAGMGRHKWQSIIIEDPDPVGVFTKFARVARDMRSRIEKNAQTAAA